MHPVVLALFPDAASAAHAARGLRAFGVARERVSIVARSHDEEGMVARVAGASPGSEIEDSGPASRLGELSGHVLAAIALVIGGAGALALTRFLGTLLFGVTASDPLTLAIVAAVMTAVALAATTIPAWRAARVDPAAALRT